MTASGTLPDWPRVSDPEAIGGLRAALLEAGYEPKRLEDELGLADNLQPEAMDLPYHVLTLGESRLATLVKLFQLRLDVEAPQAEAVLAPVPVDRLVGAGLLERDEGGIRSTVALVPFLDLFLASDWEPAARPPARSDHVLGASVGSRILTHLGVREPVDSAFDLGTGSGLQALLAARHARRVVATDVNPRALGFTELNALLNGLDNVEVRQGSLFEPVEGEAFDLISSNPPYVVSPDSEFVFRDAGLPGDSFCEVLVRELPRYLAEGGIAHVLVAWTHGADEDWSARLRDWVEGSGCDALLLRHSSFERLAYAQSGNRMHWRDPGLYRDGLERWVAYYEELGIERIGWGAIVLRRREGGGAVTALDASLSSIGPAGHHILRLLHGQGHIARLDRGDALLDARLAVADDVRLDQTVAFREGQGVIERAAVRLDGGLRCQVELDPQLPKLLALIDDGRPVGEVVAEAARQLGELRVQPETVVASALGSVRLLLELGFLVPAEDDAA